MKINDIKIYNLVFILKIWLKSRTCICLSSYGFTLMIIHYLIYEGYIISPFYDIEAKIKNDQNITFDQILYGFFYYYVELFNTHSMIIDIRRLTKEPTQRTKCFDELNLLFIIEKEPRNEYLKNYSIEYREILNKFINSFQKSKFKQSNYKDQCIFIQDPFELDHNVSKLLTKQNMNMLFNEMNVTLKNFDLRNTIKFDILHLFTENGYEKEKCCLKEKTFNHDIKNLIYENVLTRVDLRKILKDNVIKLIKLLEEEFGCVIYLENNQNCKFDIKDLSGLLKSDKLCVKFIVIMHNNLWKNARKRRRNKNLSLILENYKFFIHCNINPFSWSFCFYISQETNSKNDIFEEKIDFIKYNKEDFFNFCAIVNKKFKNL